MNLWEYPIILLDASLLISQPCTGNSYTIRTWPSSCTRRSRTSCWGCSSLASKAPKGLMDKVSGRSRQVSGRPSWKMLKKNCRFGKEGHPLHQTLPIVLLNNYAYLGWAVQLCIVYHGLRLLRPSESTRSTKNCHQSHHYETSWADK